MNQKPSLLIMIHCAENTGYAMPTLEGAFYQAALNAGFTHESIFWSFNGLTDNANPRKIHCDYHNPEASMLLTFLRANNIKQVIAFDLGYPAPVIQLLKQGGVSKIISYWGASMSSLNNKFKLAIKKMEYRLRRDKPDYFIFESEAMRSTATHGRGVPANKTGVVYLGVDTEKFFPNYGHDFYAHQQLDIPQHRRIIFYSGHMEERKGVRVIIKAALELAKKDQLESIHFLLCGNKEDEAQSYINMIKDTKAEAHVTFGGYRNDMAELMRSSAVGVIASTGWDSFTMSSIEMMASGLPLIVSNLQGLSETIEHNSNGYRITPGDYQALAHALSELCSDPEKANLFSKKSRLRAQTYFDTKQQVKNLTTYLNRHD